MTQKNKNGKTTRQLERHMKGVANHWRIGILILVANNPDITVEKITENLEGNVKTISQHIKVLAQAGLLNKKYRGHAVEHRLSPYGKKVQQFLVKF